MTRNVDIDRNEVDQSWQLVKKAKGGPGVDGVSLTDYENNLDNLNYKVWNRLSSGSYKAADVLLVDIPKAGSGYRTLGIPTVMDRVAQQVIKRRLEPILEPQFKDSSYGYRPGRQPKEAIEEVMKQSFRRQWAIDLDIKSFFDNIDHDKLMEFLQQYTDDKSILLYVARFLKADGVTAEGERVERVKGTPQGGVISPLLANLYLHEVFDKWAEATLSIQFTRYADDIIVHCVSEKQAHYILKLIRNRLRYYGLELNEKKTQIVYRGPDNRKDYSRKFVFLGYTFKPRQCKNKVMRFMPAFDNDALKRIRLKIREWKLSIKLHLEIEEIADMVRPVILGWINYYGAFYRSALYRLAEYIDFRLVKWLMKKYDCSYKKAWEKLKIIRKLDRQLFPHWNQISQRTVGAV